MKNLVYKEFRLAAHPTNYIFLSFAFMLLIPNYPYLVSFFLHHARHILYVSFVA